MSDLLRERHPSPSLERRSPRELPAVLPPPSSRSTSGTTSATVKTGVFFWETDGHPASVCVSLTSCGLAVGFVFSIVMIVVCAAMEDQKGTAGLTYFSMFAIMTFLGAVLPCLGMYVFPFRLRERRQRTRARNPPPQTILDKVWQAIDREELWPFYAAFFVVYLFLAVWDISWSATFASECSVWGQEMFGDEKTGGNITLTENQAFLTTLYDGACPSSLYVGYLFWASTQYIIGLVAIAVSTWRSFKLRKVFHAANRNLRVLRSVRS